MTHPRPLRHELPRRNAIARGAVAAAAAVAAGLLAYPAVAKPGIHGPAISTWDTRASSVVVGFRPGFLSGGHFDILSYNANFTATSGNLSSQFGVHYLNLRPDAGETVMHGLGATAIALFGFPVAQRFEDATPKAAVAFYVGAAPAALVNGHKSYVSIPFPIGLGVPWAPVKAVSITPWFEVAPGVNLDTQINQNPVTFDPDEYMVTQTPNGGTTVTFTDSAVNKVLNENVEFKVSASVGMRAGLDLAFRLGDSVDFAVNGMLGSLGGAFGSTLVGWVGGGLAFRWDKVVPALLPPDTRLLHEDCSDIEARYRACQTTGSPTMSPVPQNAAPPPSPPPAYTPPPSPGVPPAPPPSSHAPATNGYPPPPAAPPAPSAAPAVPTTSFPQ